MRSLLRVCAISTSAPLLIKDGGRWDRIAKMLLNPGDTLLVEEWTYPAALASARPIGVRWKAVPMDNQGMRPDALREILAAWDVEVDGPRWADSHLPSSTRLEMKPRPRVIYTVPVGHNPTGLVCAVSYNKTLS